MKDSLPCWVAFDVSKLFMNLLMHSRSIKSKRNYWLIFSSITFILGWFRYFSIACLIVTVLLSGEKIFRRTIPRFWTVFPKYLLKFPTNLLSSETTYSNFLTFQSFVCNPRFYGFPKKDYFRWCILHWGYSKTPIWSFCWYQAYGRWIINTFEAFRFFDEVF